MSVTLQEPQVRAYLDELRRLLGSSPDRDAVLADVEMHIQEATSRSPLDSDLIRQTLQDLGDPQVIAEGSTPSAGTATPAPWGRRLPLAAVIALLAVGDFSMPAFWWGLANPIVPGIAWLLGAVLLWSSTAWSTRAKAVGAFAVPALLGIAALTEKVTLRTDPTSAIDIAVLAGYAVLTSASSVFLVLRHHDAAQDQ